MATIEGLPWIRTSRYRRYAPSTGSTPASWASSTSCWKSPFSLAEARVLYELATRESCTATDRVELGLDPGYLSRIVQNFDAAG